MSFGDYRPLDRYSAPIDAKRCLRGVYDGRSPRSHQCTRKPIAGSAYCRVHDPELRTRAAQRRDRIWKAESMVVRAAEVVRAYKQVFEHRERLGLGKSLSLAQGFEVAEEAHNLAQLQLATIREQKP